MKKSAEILGLPIISITEGRELGMSKTLLIDAQNGKVAAITIEDDDWYRGVKLIPYESVIAIGEDAVTITHSENILNLDAAGDYEQLLIENIRVIGTKAITKTGRIQGKVSEVFIGEGGRIEKCEITAPDGSINEVSADQISIFGKQVTVVDINAEKKTKSLTEEPAFKPIIEPPQAEQPAQEMWMQPVEETTPAESFEIPAEAFETSEETEKALEEVMVPDPIVEIADEPFTPFDEEQPVVEEQTAVEEQPVVEEPPVVEETPAVEEPSVVEETPAVEESPAIEEPPVIEESTVAVAAPVIVEAPVVVETPAEEQKLAAMTRQAEDLKAALQKAKASQQPAEPQPSQRKQVEKAVDERRRRVLLGKHATKTITAESGTVVVEAGAEVTEEVLQRARLSNKFIELSMNVQ